MRLVRAIGDYLFLWWNWQWKKIFARLFAATPTSILQILLAHVSTHLTVIIITWLGSLSTERRQPGAPTLAGQQEQEEWQGEGEGVRQGVHYSKAETSLPIYITQVSSYLKIILKLFLTFVMFIKLFIYIKYVLKKLEHLDFSYKRATLHIH